MINGISTVVDAPENGRWKRNAGALTAGGQAGAKQTIL